MFSPLYNNRRGVLDDWAIKQEHRRQQCFTSYAIASARVSGEGLLSEFCSCYGSQLRTNVVETLLRVEFGVLISVNHIPELC